MVEHSPQSLGFFSPRSAVSIVGAAACDAGAWSHSQHAVDGRPLPVTWLQASYWLQPSTPVWPVVAARSQLGWLSAAGRSGRRSVAGAAHGLLET